MQKRQVLINAIMSVAQIVVSSAVLFILYRFLLKTIGIEQLGIWSLVLTTSSLTQIANCGLSGSVVKFVAKYIGRGENENVSGVIQTATLSIGVFVGFILLIGYPIAKAVLGLIIHHESLPLALSILPYAFLSLWIMLIVSACQGGLDGYQRIDIRSMLLIGGTILDLLLSFLFVPKYGLMGLAYGRVIQNILLLIISWFLLKKCSPSLPIIPYKWDKRLFKEMIAYGINFQAISITGMLYDPITKALLSKFGGLLIVGYYEMANRMVLQVRTLIVSANQVLVPVIADLSEKNPAKIKLVYITSYQLLFYLSLPLFSLIIVCAPFISEIWIGHYERFFVLFAVLLLIGRFLNTLEAPAYFANLGTGDLRWNVLSHISKGLLNLGLGVLLGVFYGGIGVVIAWVFSLALGSSIILFSFHIRHKISFIELLPKTSRSLIVACLIAILSTLVTYYMLSHRLNIITLNSIIILSFSLIVFIPFWFHSMRKRLGGWVIHELINKW